jgi:hypothetical protein
VQNLPFFIDKFSPNRGNSKFKNEMILEVLNHQKLRGRNKKNLCIFIFGLQCVAKYVER